MKLGTQIRPTPVDANDSAPKGYVDSVAGAGIYVPPEKWGQIDIPASQSATPMAALVSQLFDDVQMVRGGSVTGLNIRFNANLSGGTATATITVNGSPGTLTVVVSSGQSSGRSTQSTGIDSFSPGDTLGITLETNGTFAPITLDAEAWIEVT